MDKLPENERDNKKIIDPDHLDKISSHEELSGLLNHGLDGLDRTLKQNNYSTSLTGDEIKKWWMRKADSFGAFCEDCIEENQDSFVTKKELQQKFSKYCRKLKISGTSPASMRITLENSYGCVEGRNYVVVPSSSTLEKEQVNVWEGIKFKENIKEFFDNKLNK